MVVGTEAALGGGRVVEVAVDHAGTTDDQFAHHARRDRPSIGVVDLEPGPGDRRTDRHGVVASLTVMNRGPHRALRRAVLVGQRDPGPQLMVPIDEARRARLAGDDDLRRPRSPTRAPLEHRLVERGHQKRVCDRCRVEEIDERIGVVRFDVGGEDDGCARRQRPEEAGDTRVERGARDDEERPRLLLVGREAGLGARRQRAVRHRHATRRASGARREDHVGGVIAGDRCRRLGGRALDLRCDDVVGRERPDALADERGPRLGEVGDQRDPIGGVRRIDRHVGGADGVDRDHRGDQVGRARQAEHHPVAAFDAGLAQCSCQVGRAFAELGPRGGDAAADDGRAAAERAGAMEDPIPDRRRRVDRRSGELEHRVGRQGDLVESSVGRDDRGLDHRIEIVEEGAGVDLGERSTAELHAQVDRVVSGLDEDRRSPGDRIAVEHHVVVDGHGAERGGTEMVERQEDVDRRQALAGLAPRGDDVGVGHRSVRDRLGGRCSRTRDHIAQRGVVGAVDVDRERVQQVPDELVGGRMISGRREDAEAHPIGVRSPAQHSGERAQHHGEARPARRSQQLGRRERGLALGEPGGRGRRRHMGGEAARRFGGRLRPERANRVGDRRRLPRGERREVHVGLDNVEALISTIDLAPDDVEALGVSGHVVHDEEDGGRAVGHGLDDAAEQRPAIEVERRAMRIVQGCLDDVVADRRDSDVDLHRLVPTEASAGRTERPAQRDVELGNVANR